MINEKIELDLIEFKNATVPPFPSTTTTTTTEAPPPAPVTTTTTTISL